MGHLLVGDEHQDMSFNSIILTMETSPTFKECYTQWRNLARKLDTDDDTINNITRSINSDPSFGTSSIILEILTNWRSRSSRNATLENLLGALDLLGLNDISNVLRNKYIVSQKQAVDNLDGTPSTDETTKPISEEGKKLRSYLKYYLVDLIQMTILNDKLLQGMVDKDVFELADIEKINQSNFREDKVRRFYQILLDKMGKQPEIYDTVVEVFMNDDMNRKRGVGDLFDRYSDD